MLNLFNNIPKFIYLFSFKSLFFFSSKYLNTLHGLPTATHLGGILRVTTAPAPIVVPSPISTPGKIVTLPPIQTLLLILIGLTKAFPEALSSGSIG